jgi:hypothetical protein
MTIPDSPSHPLQTIRCPCKQEYPLVIRACANYPKVAGALKESYSPHLKYPCKQKYCRYIEVHGTVRRKFSDSSIPPIIVASNPASRTAADSSRQWTAFLLIPDSTSHTLWRIQYPRKRENLLHLKACAKNPREIGALKEPYFLEPSLPL